MAAPATVDGYVASFPPDVQRTLKAVRRAVRAAVPGAEEHVAYGMPSYRLGGGRAFLHFAAYKGHWSLFGVTAGVKHAFGKELAPYGDSGRGTLRFPYGGPVPEDLVRRIAVFRAKESQ